MMQHKISHLKIQFILTAQQCSRSHAQQFGIAIEDYHCVTPASIWVTSSLFLLIDDQLGKKERNKIKLPI